MRTRFYPYFSAHRQQSGATMIEVMVAVLVLSIGLLGVASLLGVSVRNTQSANFRSQAANLAYDYIDTARAYPNNAGAFLRPGWTSADCDFGGAPNYGAFCAAGSSAINCDRRRLDERVCRLLPGGRARMVALATDPVTRRLQVRVDICWNDDRGANPAVTLECNSDSETLYTVTADI